MRGRIDRFGVTQPNIQKLGNTGRILVELPGVKEPERVRKLLQGTASLEFWTTYLNSEILNPYLVQANKTLAELQAAGKAVAEESAEQTENADQSILDQEIAESEAEEDELAEYNRQNPLFAILHPAVDANGNPINTACIGYANYADTAKINKILAMPEIASIFPPEFIPMWTVKASEGFADGNTFELVAIKSTSRDGKAPLDGASITDARAQLGIHGHTEGQDETCNTREGEDGSEGNEGSEEEHHVAQQGNVSHETGTLVEAYHIDEYEAECDEEGDESGIDGLASEGRTHNLLLNDGSRSRKLT